MIKRKDKVRKNIMDKAMDKTDEQDLDVLNINEKFAKRFEFNKKREYLEKATKKFGEKAIFDKNQDEDDSENNESEDSDAELINPKVMEKFISTMIMLQDDKGAQELLKTNDHLFKEEDFDDLKKKEISNKEDKLTVKEMLLKSGEDQDENNIYSVNYKPKLIVDTELNKIKSDLIEAAKKDKNLDKQGDEDFLVKKKKNIEEEEQEKEELFEELKNKNIEDLDLNEIITVKNY